jgi:Xaa-Pro aminopeptidase
LVSPNSPKEPYSNSSLPFVQEALFLWFSGWHKPDSAITVDIESGISTLYTPVFDSDYALWNGFCPSVEEIKDQTGVDNVIQTNKLLATLQGSVGSPVFSASPFQVSEPQIDFINLVSVCAIARRHKEPHEIECLKEAAEATSRALESVMRICAPGMMEYELAAAFEYHGMRHGFLDLAFLTISASGPNAAFLHYRENNCILKDGDLVLFDCGLFSEHYSGDVTRTFPVNGKFSEKQKLVYGLLLECQKSLIEDVAPGITLRELQMRALEGIFDICKKCGVTNECDHSLAMRIACHFMPHGLSHHLGCNNHDLSFWPSKIEDREGRSQVLTEGMVITIEPGIYFCKERISKALNEDTGFARFVNEEMALDLAESVCGIRIEDDVLVTSDGRVVLSTCPKEIDEIEALFLK